MRCSKSFEWLLYRNSWAAVGSNDSIHQLNRLWDRVVPDGHCLFHGRFTSAILLHDNQYVMEKAFVHGVFYAQMAGRWLAAWRGVQVATDTGLIMCWLVHAAVATDAGLAVCWLAHSNLSRYQYMIIVVSLSVLPGHRFNRPSLRPHLCELARFARPPV